MIRSGGNRTSQSVMRAVARAARSAEQHRPGLRERLGQHEEDDHVQDEGEQDAPPTVEDPLGQQRVRNAWPVCRTVMLTRIGLMNSSGSPASTASACERLRMLLGVDRMGLHPADAVERRLGDGEEDEHEQQDDDAGEHQQLGAAELAGQHHQGCSWRKPAGAGPCQWWASSSSRSRARMRSASPGSA